MRADRWHARSDHIVRFGRPLAREVAKFGLARVWCLNIRPRTRSRSETARYPLRNRASVSVDISRPASARMASASLRAASCSAGGSAPTPLESKPPARLLPAAQIQTTGLETRDSKVGLVGVPLDPCSSWGFGQQMLGAPAHASARWGLTSRVYPWPLSLALIDRPGQQVALLAQQPGEFPLQCPQLVSLILPCAAFVIVARRRGLALGGAWAGGLLPWAPGADQRCLPRSAFGCPAVARRLPPIVRVDRDFVLSCVRRRPVAPARDSLHGAARHSCSPAAARWRRSSAGQTPRAGS